MQPLNQIMLKHLFLKTNLYFNFFTVHLNGIHRQSYLRLHSLELQLKLCLHCRLEYKQKTKTWAVRGPLGQELRIPLLEVWIHKYNCKGQILQGMLHKSRMWGKKNSLQAIWLVQIHQIFPFVLKLQGMNTASGCMQYSCCQGSIFQPQYV